MPKLHTILNNEIHTMTTRKERVLAKIDAAYPPTNVRNATADNRFRARCSCCYRHLHDGQQHLRVFSHQLYTAAILEPGGKNTGAGVTRICLDCAVSPNYPHSQHKLIKLGVELANGRDSSATPTTTNTQP